jgi:DNA mismatch endonuclease (patch repair protein)
MTRKSGHRRWGARGGKVPGRHRGDIMRAEQRSRVMSRIKGKDTSIELALDHVFRTRGFQCERHCGDLPGRPDFVFRDRLVVVFVDGDFWHGYRFPLWAHKLSTKWRTKIQKTRARDRRNFAALRRRGWTVVRIWEHEVEQDLCRCADRIVAILTTIGVSRARSSKRSGQRLS